MSTTLVNQSIAVIEAGQTTNGAYVACPTYPTYRYCWFRDGTFTAYAMDLWHRHTSSRRFYDWATAAILTRKEAIERCLENVKQGLPLDPADLLHTRYTLDGDQGQEDWPNFQLDGFGTLLWGLQSHAQLAALTLMPPTWIRAAHLLVRYLAALWHQPNADCWEEFSDRIAVSTLATLYAGLQAISAAFVANGEEATLSRETASQIKAFVTESGQRHGRLLKHIDGEDMVDANLLWSCVPFQGYGLYAPEEAIMQQTVACIEQDLIGKTGGVHRYTNDTFYGGGEWILLTALLGEYYVAIGNSAGAHRCLTFIETSASEEGLLPEQISVASLHPEYVQHWQESWGNVACPLLWSHANYLSLQAHADQLAWR